MAFARYSSGMKELTEDYFVNRKLNRREWLDARDGLERQLNTARRHFDPRWRQTRALRDAPQGHIAGTAKTLKSTDAGILRVLLAREPLGSKCRLAWDPLISASSMMGMSIEENLTSKHGTHTAA